MSTNNTVSALLELEDAINRLRCQATLIHFANLGREASPDEETSHDREAFFRATSELRFNAGQLTEKWEALCDEAKKGSAA